MKCEYCGRVLQPGETECPGCGAPVENLEAAKQNESNGKIEVKVNGVNISIDGLGRKNNNEGPISMGQSAEKNVSQINSMPNMSSTPGYTPSNTAELRQNIRYAGFWIRFVAYLIDAAIMAVVSATGIGAIATFFYEPFCEAYWDGATIGKKVVGIKVVDTNIQPISLGKAYCRFFSKILSYITIYIGFIMAAFSGTKQGLHDKMAGTYVIYK